MKNLIRVIVLAIAIAISSIATRLVSPPILLGDIDRDNRIDSMDMLLIKRHILEIDKLNYFEKRRADVNQDGEISNADLVIIKKYILIGE